MPSSTRTIPTRPTAPAPAAPAPARWHLPAWLRGATRKPAPVLNLALQGGGAHGAFTWGVLDVLAQQPGLRFEGLSGSSAGAMNAVVFAEGWRRGGAEGARAALAAFWQALGAQLPLAWLLKGQGEDIALAEHGKLLLKWVGQFSPEQINPLDLNGLRDLLRAQIDFDALRAHSPFKLFIAATQANTGRLRLFREHELSVDVLLASACLPRLHRAVIIDGEPYWDGGYAANPAVYPLFYECRSRDVMLVLLSPLRHAGTPRSVEEIEQRALELAFSANLMREMRSFVQAAAFAGQGGGWRLRGRLERRLQAVRFHMIDAQDIASMQRSETKLIAHGPFLELLRDHGQARARAWLKLHATALGERATVDVAACFA
ncbi:MAG: patatin-like phospholipase family protein [Burkholderiales bacterium]|nr:patatin-like phospholipase family protein [Burkholderiales bacterium]